MNMFLLILLGALGLFPVSANATPLSVTSASCAIHTFCTVAMSTLTSSILDSGGDNSITEYASKAAWDRRNRRFYFVGQGHLSCAKFISYDDTLDTWTSVIPPWRGPCPAPAPFFYHSYQHNTFNPLLQKFYARRYGTGMVDVYDVASAAWTTTPTNDSVRVQCCGALEWFPEIGRIVHFGDESGSFGALYGYQDGSSTWDQIGVSNSYAAGNYDNAAVYNPVYKVLVFGGGGGDRHLYKLDRAGNVSAMNSPPIGIDEATPNGTIFTVDPVSGMFILVGPNGVIYQMDMSSDPKGTWSQVTGVIAPFANVSAGNGVYGVIAVPIPNYGVIGFLACGGIADCNGGVIPTFYVYKHTVPNAHQTKCMDPGVILCEGFESAAKDTLFYNWDATNDTKCNGSGLGPQYSWSFDGQQNTNGTIKGNTIANDNATHTNCASPILDSVQKNNGRQSLQHQVYTNSGAAQGYVAMPYGFIGDGNSVFIAPNSPFGATVYYQFYQRFDSSHVGTNYLCNPEVCGGWKHWITFGNPPNGSSSSTLEVTHNNGWQRDVPQMYGQQGRDDYGIEDLVDCKYAGSGYEVRLKYRAPLNPSCKHYPANQWHEYTVKITVGGAENSNSPASHVQMWVDGTLVIDNPSASINWGSGDGQGVGNIAILPYHTNKDSRQSHPTGFMWTDDIVVSTQPIVMVNGVVPPSSPPAAPTRLKTQ